MFILNKNYRFCLFVFLANQNGKAISPLHDIPLHADDSKNVYNMVVEVPRWTNAKMEVILVVSLYFCLSVDNLSLFGQMFGWEINQFDEWTNKQQTHAHTKHWHCLLNLLLFLVYQFPSWRGLMDFEHYFFSLSLCFYCCVCPPFLYFFFSQFECHYVKGQNER